MEESSNKQPPRCPCGFWGSNQTLGLCSKCYCEAQGNQVQRNLLSSDSGKPTVSHCHNQLRNRTGQSGRMDSKHFPSHSTTDNLPSSLSSPGERPTLTNPPSNPVDPGNVATSSGGGTVPLLSANLATSTTTHEDGDQSPSGGSQSVPECSRSSPPIQQLTPVVSSSSDISQSSASSDQSYDPKRDADLCFSVSSSSSIVSVTSSTAVSHPFSSPSASSQMGGEDCSPLRGSNSATEPCVETSPSGSGHTKTSSSPSGSPTNPATVLSNGSGVQPVADGTDSCTNGKESPTSKDNAVTSAQAEDKLEPPTPCAKGTSSPTSGTEITPDSMASLESPAKRGLKRTRDDMETTEEVAEASPQKNRKRCFTCSCKLELAQRTIGKCRCDRIFCALHRLPELHHCDFNHKEDGRREAREKMIVPTRHLGPSFRREDHS